MSSSDAIDAIGIGSYNLIQELCVASNQPKEIMVSMWRANCVYSAHQSIGNTPPITGFEKLEKTRTGKFIISVIEHEEQNTFGGLFIGKMEVRKSDNIRYKYLRKHITEFALNSLIFASKKGWSLS